MSFDYEVLIIGGGPAGLSAGLTLGRISRTALICDDGKPRNAPSSHVNNFPTRDGIHPAQWRTEVRKNLEKYKTIEFFQGSVLTVEKLNPGFAATLSSGETKKFKKVILAYGVKDSLPPIEGFKELWGKSIFHCPYCHGFEVRGSRLGLFSNGDMAFHLLPIIYNLSPELVIFTNGNAEFNSEQWRLLEQKQIPVIEDKILRFNHENEKLQSVLLSNGETIERDGLFYTLNLPLQLKSNIGESLGCQKTQFGTYKVTEKNETTVPGVFAGGDNMTMAHSVLFSSAAGSMAAAASVFELLGEELRN